MLDNTSSTSVNWKREGQPSITPLLELFGVTEIHVYPNNDAMLTVSSQSRVGCRKSTQRLQVTCGHKRKKIVGSNANDSFILQGNAK